MRVFEAISMNRGLWHSAPSTLLLLVGCAGAPSEAEAPEAPAPQQQAGQATSASVAPAPVDVAPAWQDDDPLAAHDAVVEAEPTEPMPPPESAAKPCIRVEGKCVGDSTGVEECDEFLVTAITCKGVPEDAHKTLVEAATTMADNVKKASDAEAREALAHGCREALESLTGCK